jgi:hypothetical protein
MAERLGFRLERMDEEITDWANITREELLKKVNELTLTQRGKLAEESIRRKKNTRRTLKRTNGEIDRVSFKFPKHGIYIQHGVGRGRKVGSAAAKENAIPWITDVLPSAIELLADRLEEEFADITSKEVRFLIPGIIDIKV